MKSIKLKKGQKRKLARELRGFIGIPARTICRTTKNQSIIEQLNKHKYDTTNNISLYGRD